ncbi:MAG: carboxy terminal-processing peptidase [Vibrionaceae bacterium]
MIYRIRFCVAALSLALAASSVALEAKYAIADLPNLASEPQHKIASQRIARRFETSHYKVFELNDAFSSKIFDRYINILDYNKLFFTKNDIAALSKYRSVLDDQLRAGDTAAAYAIFSQSMRKRFLRYQYALSLLDNEISFTEDEYIILDRSKLDWAVNEIQLDELWRQRVKSDALNLKLSGKKWSDIKTTLAKRYNTALKHLVQTNSEDAFQVYLNAFAREIDPHTSYLSPRTAEQFQSEMNLSLEGIGAVLQAEDDYTVLRSLVAGGPAAKTKKLAPGDRIVGVAQKGGKMVDVVGWRLDDVVQLIKGPKGSEVLLEILPEGAKAKSYVISLVRDKIRLEDLAVKSEIIESDGKKIGVLSVPSFYVGLTENAKSELAKLQKEKIAGLVVDLRNNGGGSLAEASSLTGLFIASGPVVQVRDSYGRVKVNSDNDGLVSYAGPLTVLINRYSASASEIFAAALQDYGRALVVGEQSFGKGTVQQHRSLNHIYDLFSQPLGHVQYTIQKFYRINGGSTQHKGVLPDLTLPSTADMSEVGESIEDNALPWDSIAKVNYLALGNFAPLLPRLSALHSARIKNDMEFGFVTADLAQYKAKKRGNRLSLNENKRLEEQEADDKKRLQRINDRQRALGKKPFAKLEDLPKDHEEPDPYLTETAAITADLVKMLTN